MHSASATRTSRVPRGALAGGSVGAAAAVGVRAPPLRAGEPVDSPAPERVLPEDSPPGVWLPGVPLLPLASDLCDAKSPEPGASLRVGDSSGATTLSRDRLDFSE